MLATTAFLSLLVLAAEPPADEKVVKQADIPPAVLAAVDKKYPAAKKLSFAREGKGEKDAYEVSISDRGRKIDIGLSPEGKILIEEHLIALEAVPPDVRKALADSRKYNKWRVERSERVVTEENETAPVYELVVAKGNKRVQLVFDKDGKLTKEEPKTEKGND
jgi:hypothetical protein